MNISRFAELDKTMAYFRPLSPMGRAAAETLSVTDDPAEISRRLTGIRLALSFSKAKKIKADKIRYHLKRLPLLEEKEEYSADGIFLCKKFLNNASGVFSCLTEKEKKFFGASFSLQQLLEELSMDGRKDEFYLADAYEPALAAVRKSIEELDRRLEEETACLYEKIKKETGLDFSGKDFLIVGREIKQNGEKLLYLEPYDNFSFTARPILSPGLVDLGFEKEQLLREEKEAESKVLSRLSASIKKHFKTIMECSAALQDIDLAFAGAAMAEELGLSEPKVGRGDKIECEGAFFPPLKKELDRLRIDYTALSFSFTKRINVITGSNMGGKTIALKTIALCQTLAQKGLFVPAVYYCAPVFKSISYLGCESEISGLSSFGAEISDLVSVLRDSKEPKLIFADEFAKTTNSSQACALFSALIENFSASRVWLFAATHLGGITATRETDFLSMKGFDNDKYSSRKDLTCLSEIERLKLINKHMDYTLIRNRRQMSFYDALNIARLLGLDEDIVNSAKKYLEEKSEIKATEDK
ncbi:MAG: endonuclease MutS2 [Elusimicrobiota bacterium]